MTINCAATPVFLAPRPSTASPSRIRRIAPDNVGTATISPFCSGERWSDSPIWTPSGPRMVQTMKEKSK